jgi:hypothetical protein
MNMESARGFPQSNLMRAASISAVISDSSNSTTRALSLWRVAARVAIEPCIGFLEACVEAIASDRAKTTDAQRRAQDLVELVEVIAAWPKLAPELRTACLAMTRSAIERRIDRSASLSRVAM